MDKEARQYKSLFESQDKELEKQRAEFNEKLATTQKQEQHQSIAHSARYPLQIARRSGRARHVYGPASHLICTAFRSNGTGLCDLTMSIAGMGQKTYLNAKRLLPLPGGVGLSHCAKSTPR